MSCPKCLESSRQYWHKAMPANYLCPAEPEGYDCGWCGLWYRPDAKRFVDCDQAELEREYHRDVIIEWRDNEAREQIDHIEWNARFGGEEDEL